MPSAQKKIYESTGSSLWIPGSGECGGTNPMLGALAGRPRGPHRVRSKEGSIKSAVGDKQKDIKALLQLHTITQSTRSVGEERYK